MLQKDAKYNLLKHDGCNLTTNERLSQSILSCIFNQKAIDL